MPAVSTAISPPMTAWGALRRSLRESAQAVLGPAVKDILLLDILRQDG